MDSNDKPFACSFPGCNQKFVTEDRLSCHIQKHDINFENITASLFTDQTPTPTTFLRDCENIGLFQELPLATKNPFDESFRKAVDVHITEPDGVDSPSIPILPDSASLLGMINTPTTGKDTPNFMKFRPVFLTPDVEKLHSQMSNDNLDTPSLDNITSLPLLHRISIDTPTTTSSSKRLVLGLPHHRIHNLPDSAGSDAVDADVISKDTSSPCITPSSDGTISSTCPSHSPLLSSEPALTPTQPATVEPATTPTSMQPMSITRNNVSPTPKLAEVSKTRLAPTLLSRIPQLPQAVSAAQPLTTRSSIIQPATSSGQSLVMLHLNKSGEAYLVPADQVFAQTNNKALPVKFSDSMSAVTTNGSQPVVGNGAAVERTAVAPADVLADSSQSPLTLAKMKLKQALIKHHTVPQAESSGHQSDGDISVRSRHSSSASGVRKRSLSRSDEELDEDEKKRKNLQRNRDAARRCRKKKKFFIQALEDKLKATNLLNTQLQSENANLKMEIVDLKSLFIAHKDCDVTKKQLSEGSLNSLLIGKSTTAARVDTQAASRDDADHIGAKKLIMGTDMYIS